MLHFAVPLRKGLYEVVEGVAVSCRNPHRRDSADRVQHAVTPASCINIQITLHLHNTILQDRQLPVYTLRR
jgi:hypothetical protein